MRGAFFPDFEQKLTKLTKAVATSKAIGTVRSLRGIPTPEHHPTKVQIVRD